MSTLARGGAALLTGAALVLTGALTLVAQEPPAAKNSEASAKRAYDASRRVPAFYGEIGLTPEQRASIYKIRGKHQAKIADLQKQLDAARRDELAECETVLSDTQKQLLEQRRRAAAETKGAARKKGADDKTAGGAAADTAKAPAR
jgi:hypothetical protein